MHVQQHAARRDADCDPRGEACEQRPCRACASAPEQERGRRVEGRRRRRVAARERRPEGRRDRVERGPQPIDELLDRQRQGLLAAHDGEDERHNPDGLLPDRLGDREDDAQDDDDVDAPELRDVVEEVRRRPRRVTVSPFGDALVDPGQVCVRAHQVGERAEQHSAANHQDQCQRERKSRRDGRIEPRVQQRAQPRMPGDRLAGLLRRVERRRQLRPGDPRVAPGDEPDDEADCQRKCEEDEYRHSGTLGSRPRAWGISPRSLHWKRIV